jgi:predicted DNA-binding transcriptional regulator AlpA
VSDIHHENFRSQYVSDSRPRPSRLKRTAVSNVLARLYKQAPIVSKANAPKIIAAAWRPVPFRGMNRSEAAAYIGISPSKFDMMVKEDRMPKPIPIDARKVWDKIELDEAFEALKAEPSENPWDHAA